MSSTHTCPHCQKRCKSVRGLTQHVNQSPDCLAKQEALIQMQKNPSKRERVNDEDLDLSETGPRRSKRRQRPSVLLPKSIAFPSPSHIHAPPDPEGFDAFPQDSDKASTRVRPSQSEATDVSDKESMQDSYVKLEILSQTPR